MELKMESKFDKLYNKIIKESLGDLENFSTDNMIMDELYSTSDPDMEPVRVLKNTVDGEITYYVKYGDEGEAYPVNIQKVTGFPVSDEDDERRAAEELAEEIADCMADNGFTFEQALAYMNL